MRSWIKFF